MRFTEYLIDEAKIKELCEGDTDAIDRYQSDLDTLGISPLAKDKPTPQQARKAVKAEED